MVPKIPVSKAMGFQGTIERVDIGVGNCITSVRKGAAFPMQGCAATADEVDSDAGLDRRIQSGQYNNILGRGENCLSPIRLLAEHRSRFGPRLVCPLSYQSPGDAQQWRYHLHFETDHQGSVYDRPIDGAR
jgi:hypothetical protein